MLPEVEQHCGVSRAAVSRKLQEARAEALKGLCERRFEQVDLWMLKAALDENRLLSGESENPVDNGRLAA